MASVKFFTHKGFRGRVHVIANESVMRRVVLKILSWELERRIRHFVFHWFWGKWTTEWCTNEQMCHVQYFRIWAKLMSGIVARSHWFSPHPHRFDSWAVQASFKPAMAIYCNIECWFWILYASLMPLSPVNFNRFFLVVSWKATCKSNVNGLWKVFVRF